MRKSKSGSYTKKLHRPSGMGRFNSGSRSRRGVSGVDFGFKGFSNLLRRFGNFIQYKPESRVNLWDSFYKTGVSIIRFIVHVNGGKK